MTPNPQTRPSEALFEIVSGAAQFKFRTHAAMFHFLASRAPTAKCCADCGLEDCGWELATPCFRGHSLVSRVHCVRLFVVSGGSWPVRRVLAEQGSQKAVVSGVHCVRLCPASLWGSGCVQKLCLYDVSRVVVSGCSQVGDSGAQTP
eukprot:3008609-Alexandrium_andersonii.AAC.1